MFDTLKKLEISTGLFQMQTPGVDLQITFFSWVYLKKGALPKICDFALTNVIMVFAVLNDTKGKFFVQMVRDVVEINENDFIRFGLLITK